MGRVTLLGSIPILEATVRIQHGSKINANPKGKLSSEVARGGTSPMLLTFGRVRVGRYLSWETTERMIDPCSSSL